MHRGFLPPELGDSFSRRAAIDAGVTPSRLRAGDLARPFHGVRALTPASARGPAHPSGEAATLERVRWYAHRMTEHEFFTHATAAVLWGLPLPFRVGADRPLDVGVFAPRRNPAGRGVRGRSVKPGLAHVVVHPDLGVSVASPASTWALLASTLTDVYDLVAVGDAAVRMPLHPSDPPALAAIEQLQAAAFAGRRPGVVRLRTALSRVSTRSASRPESWLRLILVDAGLPEPRANHDVFSDSRWLARVDLAYPQWRLALEYEGDHHRVDEDQWRSDLARVDRLAEAGWRVIRVTKRDVFDSPSLLVARVRRAIALAVR